jgi:hypothetical protein
VTRLCGIKSFRVECRGEKSPRAQDHTCGFPLTWKVTPLYDAWGSQAEIGYYLGRVNRIFFLEFEMNACMGACMILVGLDLISLSGVGATRVPLLPH